jgi:hypothetical protein
MEILLSSHLQNTEGCSSLKNTKDIDLPHSNSKLAGSQLNIIIQLASMLSIFTDLQPEHFTAKLAVQEQIYFEDLC